MATFRRTPGRSRLSLSVCPAGGLTVGHWHNKSHRSHAISAALQRVKTRVGVSCTGENAHRGFLYGFGVKAQAVQRVFGILTSRLWQTASPALDTIGRIQRILRPVVPVSRQCGRAGGNRSVILLPRCQTLISRNHDEEGSHSLSHGYLMCIMMRDAYRCSVKGILQT